LVAAAATLSEAAATNVPIPLQQKRQTLPYLPNRYIRSYAIEALLRMAGLERSELEANEVVLEAIVGTAADGIDAAGSCEGLVARAAKQVYVPWQSRWCPLSTPQDPF
jgi:hypothetical protein